jgi:hypothetical protein
MSKRFTRAIVVAVAAIGLAAIADAVRSHDSPPQPVALVHGSTTTAPSSVFEARDPAVGTNTALPRCDAPQISLSIEDFDGSPSAVVRHVWGSPCRLAPLRAELAVRDANGRRVRRSTIASADGVTVTGDFSPGVEQLLAIRYFPTCEQRGPFRAFVNIGPYSAEATLPPPAAQEACHDRMARALAEAAGYQIVEWTGSAWVARGRGQSFYIWMTDYTSHSQLRGEAYRVAARIDGTPVYSDGVRLAWILGDATVWISAGPTEDSVAPTVNQLEDLVAPSGAVRMSG